MPIVCDDEKSFFAAIDAEPEELSTLLIFADWLEENHDPRAAGYRKLAEMNLCWDVDRMHRLTIFSERAGPASAKDKTVPYDWFSHLECQVCRWSSHGSDASEDFFDKWRDYDSPHELIDDLARAWVKWQKEPVMVKAQRIVNAAAKLCSQLQEVTLHTSYAEPGYSDPESGVIATGNWNSVTRWDSEAQRHELVDDTPEKLAKALEELGVELEWSDEWSSCSDCGKLIRTQPDSYSWKPSYRIGDGEILCTGCSEGELHGEG